MIKSNEKIYIKENIFKLSLKITSFSEIFLYNNKINYIIIILNDIK